MWYVNNEKFLYSFINYLNIKIGFFFWNVYYSVFKFIENEYYKKISMKFKVLIV